MFRSLRIFALLLFVVVYGCGDSNGTINPGQNPTSPVTVSPTIATASPGQAVVYNIAVQSATVPANPVVLNVTGLPAGATAIFNPPQVSAVNNVLNGTSVLTVATAASTPPGTYTLGIQGPVGSASFGVAQATLTVQSGGGAQNFNLAVSPGSASINSSSPATFTVTVTSTSGTPFTDPITLTVSGGSGNYSVSNPSPAVLNLNGQTSASSVFTVSQTPGSTSTTPATLTITATGGGVTQTATVTVQSL